MMKAKILKVLRKIKYDYRYGLFDLLRRREPRVWAPYTPSDLTKLAFCDGIHHDSLVMVSASYPVSEECVENLCPLEENHAISHMAVENLRKLFEASESVCGEKILFTSTYRTLAFQSSIYGVNPYAAKPGESEHHSGLVADIKVDGYAQRRFIISKTGKWMARHAHEYGFVIRYPLWGEKRTGVDYEPWHLRYVGAPHAEIMYRGKMVLEDYLAKLETGDFFRYGDYVITAQKGCEFSFPREVKDVYISQNTKGGYVLWGKLKND